MCSVICNIYYTLPVMAVHVGTQLISLPTMVDNRSDLAGQIHNEERRMGVRCDLMGDPEPGPTSPVRTPVRRRRCAVLATAPPCRGLRREQWGDQRMQG